MSLKLIQLAHSPWTQKARCALAHHGLPFETVEYRPFLDEPGLRLSLARRGQLWPRRVSVPVLLTPDAAVTDSWEIARYADRVGTNTSLIPRANDVAIADWNARSDRLLASGRARFMVRVLGAESAMRELVPGVVSGAPPFVLRSSMQLFNAKYGIRVSDFADHGAHVRAELEALRAALSDGRRYLTGSLSYADFAMGLGLQVIAPLPNSSFGPHSATLASEPELVEEYAELVRWRDALHAEHGLLH